MKSLTLFLIAFCACSALTLTALAGPEALPRDSKDKEIMAAPAPSCPINWTGFYIGIHGGYGWGQADTNVTGLPQNRSLSFLRTTADSEPEGYFGGGQLGYNRQWGCFVLGVETDFSGSDMNGTKTISPIIVNGMTFPDSRLTTHQDTDWFGTFRGRVGFTPFCRLLLYGTGGLVYGNVNYSANTDFLGVSQFPTSFSQTQVGWTGGGGLEYALTQRWSMKVEYLYYDLGDESRTANAVPANPPFQVHYNWDTTAHTIRGGLNFKF